MEKLKDKLSGIIYYGGIVIIMVLVGLGMRSCMPAGPAAEVQMNPSDYIYKIYYYCGGESMCEAEAETKDVNWIGGTLSFTTKSGESFMTSNFYVKIVKK